MRLLCVGLNWKTPIRLRERLSYDRHQLSAALGHWKDRHGDAELAILSTCNRTEIYAAESPTGPSLDIDDVAQFLAGSHGVSLAEFFEHLYFHEDAGVLLHLFKVASGLDSLILGEAQILAQVKEAYQSAVEGHTAVALTHALFQRAIGVAKRVHSETGLGKGRLSIASAGIDHIRGVFEHFGDKTVLVIGAGKIAELTLVHLSELKPGRLLLANRSFEKALELSKRFGGSVRPFEELARALVDADIVISSTGADEPIVHKKDFDPILKARRNRLMAILDIAVPRDFEAGIGDLENVLLWNIDDLEKVRDRTLRARTGELDSALRIVDAETAAFQIELAGRQSGPVIGHLEREFQKIIDQELEWLLPRLNGIEESEREKIRHFAHRLKNKFLHQPKIALRRESHGSSPGFLDAFRKLFGIPHE